MTLRRAGLLVAGALLLVAGIYAAARGGLADSHYYNASVILAAADQAKRPPGAADLASAQASLAEALALEPANPLFVEQRARIQQMRAQSLPRGSPAAHALLRQSLKQFRSAALMRPGSPYVWAAIASIKQRLNDLDAEFYGALDRAARYGEWEPAIQLALVDIGFGSWQLLTEPARRLVLGAANRALLRQEPEVRRIAVRYRALSSNCAHGAASQAAPPGFCVKK